MWGMNFIKLLFSAVLMLLDAGKMLSSDKLTCINIDGASCDSWWA